MKRVLLLLGMLPFVEGNTPKTEGQHYGIEADKRSPLPTPPNHCSLDSTSCFGLWMDKIHFAPLFKAMVETITLLIFARLNQTPGVLRWCEMDFFHPQYFGHD